MTAWERNIWMWSQAFATLERAEGLHRHFFHPRHAQGPAWEPPVDMLETDREVLILVALPGVDPREVQAVIDQNELLIAGERRYPPALLDAVIHRLELPQGRFTRRVRLPAGQYEGAGVSELHGCLLITLRKLT